MNERVKGDYTLKKSLGEFDKYYLAIFNKIFMFNFSETGSKKVVKQIN